MFKQGLGDFKYFVGIGSLAQVATPADQVCVLNILGGESSEVTPISHAYSGGNVMFGTAPGKGGQVLTTTLGDIPVYNNVREGLQAGHRFNCGVVYLPPPAARDGVAELIRVNPDLKKIFIITEKFQCTTRTKFAPWGNKPAWTSSVPMDWAWRTPGTRCASAARSAATTRPTRCGAARSRSSRIPAAFPPPSPSTCA